MRGLSDAALCLSAHSFRRAARRCVAVALVVLSAIATGCLPGPVRVMSYNIRFASSDGPDRWELRRDGVLERIRAFEPDVLGLQEVLSSQAEFLISELPDYTFVGVGRDDGHKAGEMVPILFRNRTFTLVGHGHLWLSEHPERPGSIGWDAALPRMATWVKLQFRRNPYLHVTVFNTHFDHVGQRARVESAELLRRWVETLGGTPVIVMGDFNLRPGSPGYQALTGDRGNLAELRDAYAWLNLPEEDASTFNGFDVQLGAGPRLEARAAPESSAGLGSGVAQSRRIDWILCSRRFEPIQAGIDRTLHNARPPSDHWPVSAILRVIPLSPTGAM